MGKKDRYHQKLNSFNPSWCLLPSAPPTKVAAVAFAVAVATPQHRRPQRAESVKEPTSPRVGCMGQIRRCKPTPAASSTGPTLERLISSWWSRTGSPPRGASVTNRAKARVGSVEGMDPPRPVEKKEVLAAAAESSVSLWKRRCRPGSRSGLSVTIRMEEMVL